MGLRKQFNSNLNVTIKFKSENNSRLLLPPPFNLILIKIPRSDRRFNEAVSGFIYVVTREWWRQTALSEKGEINQAFASLFDYAKRLIEM